MTLTTKHRTEIYHGLTPVIGEEATEAMLAHFPAREADEPITREYLDARFAEQDRRIDARFVQIDLRFAELDRSIEERFHRHTIRMGSLLVSTMVVAIAVATYLTSLVS